MKYVIVGRTGTGKNTILSALAAAGLKPLKTHTDRKKRFPEEDSYYFHTKEETAAIPKEQKLLLTVLDGDERFAMKNDLEDMDICVLDPSGFYEFCSLFPDECIHLIHVTADADKARGMAGKRHDDRALGMSIYDSRYADEDKQFTDFENAVNAVRNRKCQPVVTKNGNIFPSNCVAVYGFHNPLDNLKPVEIFTKSVMTDHKTVKNAVSLVETAIALNCVEIADNNLDKIILWRMRGSEEKADYVTREMFADILLMDSEGMTRIMRSILERTPISVK